MNELHVELIDGVWFGVACDGQRVFATSFASSAEKALRCLLDSVPFNMPFQASSGSVFAEKVLRLMKSVYDGEDIALKVAFAVERLPEYTRKVLQTVSLIPTGYVATYGSVAEAAGGGARAVGNVMAANPFAPIVPCHRVVSANFALGGYGGGLDVKVELLKREKRGYIEKREILADGRKLQVFPVEFVLEKLKKSS